MEIIDISLPIFDGMPTYPGTMPTSVTTVKSASGQSFLSDLHLTSHAGTHIDAPAHADKFGKTLNQLELEIFYGPARVLDMTDCQSSIGASDLGSKNIKSLERILLKTKNSLAGLDKFNDDFIYLAPDGAEYLAQLGVKLVGIDSLSIKQRGSKDNTSHTALLSKNIPILEGLNLKSVSESEYLIAAFPLALQGDGAPTRAVLIKELEAPKPLTDLSQAKLFTDGGSRGNPGESAVAIVICNMDDNVVEKSGKYIGVTTNNQAEYIGLLTGLEKCLELGVNHLQVNMDSELVVKQVTGQYKIKNVDLLPHYHRAKDLAAKFTKIEFRHVPRALNVEADREVNRILDDNKK